MFYLHELCTLVNPKDFEADVKPQGKEFQFDVQFEGIDLSLAQGESDFLYTGLTGNRLIIMILCEF